MSDLVERLREGTTIRLSETSSTYTPPPKLQTEAAARIEALERERAALRDERDSLSSIVSSGIDDVAGAALDDAESALAASQAEASRMREALRPFAEYMGDMDRDNLGNPLPDDAGVGWVYLTQGDFRRAKDALSSGSKT